MKSLVTTFTLLFLGLFATVSLHAEGPINTPGIVHEAVDGTITFRADSGTTYYVWADQPKEELTPFVDKRIQLQANSRVTPRGLDFIAWVVKVTEI